MATAIIQEIEYENLQERKLFKLKLKWLSANLHIKSDYYKVQKGLKAASNCIKNSNIKLSVTTA